MNLMSCLTEVLNLLERKEFNKLGYFDKKFDSSDGVCEYINARISNLSDYRMFNKLRKLHANKYNVDVSYPIYIPTRKGWAYDQYVYGIRNKYVGVSLKARILYVRQLIEILEGIQNERV